MTGEREALGFGEDRGRVGIAKMFGGWVETDGKDQRGENRHAYRVWVYFFEGCVGHCCIECTFCIFTARLNSGFVICRTQGQGVYSECWCDV